MTHPEGRTEGEDTFLNFSHNKLWAVESLGLFSICSHHFEVLLWSPLSLINVALFCEFLLLLLSQCFWDVPEDNFRVFVSRACDSGPVRRNRSKSYRREITLNFGCSKPFTKLQLWVSWSGLSSLSGKHLPFSTEVLPTDLQASLIASKTELKLAGWHQTHNWLVSSFIGISSLASMLWLFVTLSLSTISLISSSFSLCCIFSVIVVVSAVFICLQRKDTGQIAPWGNWSSLYNIRWPSRLPVK